MEQKHRELLLKDFGSRLYCGVKVTTNNPAVKLGIVSGVSINGKITVSTEHADIVFDVTEVKPYLRSMSSMTDEEAKELLFVRFASKYGESCVYIKNFIKLNGVSFQKKPPYKGSIAVWFSFENKIGDTSQTQEYSKCEDLGQINDITLAEIDWLNAHKFDYRGLIPMGLAIEVTKANNPYKD